MIDTCTTNDVLTKRQKDLIEMKLTDKEKTVIADLGINTAYEQEPVQAVKDIAKILGTTPTSAKAVLRSLKGKNILEEVETEDEEMPTVIQFTNVGIDEALKLNPVDEPELDDMPDDEDDMPEIDEVDMDEEEPTTLVKKAAKNAKLKAAAKADSKRTPGATRTSHAGCDHESTKAARAKCRKDRAKAAASATA